MSAEDNDKMSHLPQSDLDILSRPSCCDAVSACPYC